MQVNIREGIAWHYIRTALQTPDTKHETEMQVSWSLFYLSSHSYLWIRNKNCNAFCM